MPKQTIKSLNEKIEELNERIEHQTNQILDQAVELYANKKLLYVYNIVVPKLINDAVKKINEKTTPNLGLSLCSGKPVYDMPPNSILHYVLKDEQLMLEDIVIPAYDLQAEQNTCSCDNSCGENCNCKTIIDWDKGYTPLNPCKSKDGINWEELDRRYYKSLTNEDNPYDNYYKSISYTLNGKTSDNSCNCSCHKENVVCSNTACDECSNDNEPEEEKILDDENKVDNSHLQTELNGFTHHQDDLQRQPIYEEENIDENENEYNDLDYAQKQPTTYDELNKPDEPFYG
jgi:hypothetical protein